MKYLLDANVVIALLNDPDSHPAHEIRRHHPSDIAISSIVAHELYYGAFKSRRREHNVALIDALQVLESDKEDAGHAGELRTFLASSGISIGPYDALIAGQAKARNLTLVCFSRQVGTHHSMGTA